MNDVEAELWFNVDERVELLLWQKRKRILYVCESQQSMLCLKSHRTIQAGKHAQQCHWAFSSWHRPDQIPRNFQFCTFKILSSMFSALGLNFSSYPFGGLMKNRWWTSGWRMKSERCEKSVVSMTDYDCAHLCLCWREKLESRDGAFGTETLHNIATLSFSIVFLALLRENVALCKREKNDFLLWASCQLIFVSQRSRCAGWVSLVSDESNTHIKKKKISNWTDSGGIVKMWNFHDKQKNFKVIKIGIWKMITFLRLIDCHTKQIRTWFNSVSIVKGFDNNLRWWLIDKWKFKEFHYPVTSEWFALRWIIWNATYSWYRKRLIKNKKLNFYSSTISYQSEHNNEHSRVCALEISICPRRAATLMIKERKKYFFDSFSGKRKEFFFLFEKEK